jgi:hypothetical protein
MSASLFNFLTRSFASPFSHETIKASSLKSHNKVLSYHSAKKIYIIKRNIEDRDVCFMIMDIKNN